MQQEISEVLFSRLVSDGIAVRTFCSTVGVDTPTLLRKFGGDFTADRKNRIPLLEAQSLAKKIQEARDKKELTKRRKPLDEGLLPYWKILLDQP